MKSKTEVEIRNSISGHNARNAELLRHIQEKGVAIGEIRSIEHQFYAQGQKNAALLARELYNRGYLVLVLAPPGAEDDSDYWNVEVGIQRTPAEAASHSVTEELVRLAAKFDADYDGWGTLI
jgi:regulator of RNase E activity RraB